MEGAGLPTLSLEVQISAEKLLYLFWACHAARAVMGSPPQGDSSTLEQRPDVGVVVIRHQVPLPSKSGIDKLSTF
jgi:hypothetical protein